MKGSGLIPFILGQYEFTQDATPFDQIVEVLSKMSPEAREALFDMFAEPRKRRGQPPKPAQLAVDVIRARTVRYLIETDESGAKISQRKAIRQLQWMAECLRSVPSDRLPEEFSHFASIWLEGNLESSVSRGMKALLSMPD